MSVGVDGARKAREAALTTIPKPLMIPMHGDEIMIPTATTKVPMPVELMVAITKKQMVQVVGITKKQMPMLMDLQLT